MKLFNNSEEKKEVKQEEERLQKQYGENYFVTLKKYRWWTNRIPTPKNCNIRSTNLKNYYAIIVTNDKYN
jgi:hypothetical protein